MAPRKETKLFRKQKNNPIFVRANLIFKIKFIYIIRRFYHFLMESFMSRNDFEEEEENGAISQINVTPLVDIMFTILIIFMLVSAFVNQEAIEIDLPRAATGKEIDKKTLSILVSKEGDYYLSGKKLNDIKALNDELKYERKANESLQVVISADRMVYHGKIVDIIDLIRQNGISNFAINVEYDEEYLKKFNE